MRWLIALVIVAAVGAARPGTAQELASNEIQAGRSGLSIVENGVDKSNNRLFTIRADRVDVADVLRTFFKRAGAEVAIDQDVTGLIDLTVRNVTFREALQYVVQYAKPQIKVTKGTTDNVYHVSRDPEAQRAAEAIANRIQQLSGTGRGGFPAVVPNNLGPQVNAMNGLNSPQFGTLGDRPVTIDVPEDRPIPLADALGRISQQARLPIYLDRRVPRDLSFAGSITEAPVSLVLQRIAAATGLKLLASPTQVTFVPTDQFTLRVNDMLLNQYPNAPCSRCGQHVSSLWSYCPYCGQLTPRGAQMQGQRGAMPPLRSGPAGKR